MIAGPIVPTPATASLPSPAAEGRAPRRATACPKCRLLNPPSATRCDCGYDFNSGRIEESYVRSARLDTGSLGVGVTAGLLGILGVGIVYALASSPVTRRGVWIGFGVRFAINVVGAAAVLANR